MSQLLYFATFAPLTISRCLTVLVASGFLLSFAVLSLKDSQDDVSLRALWRLGFGALRLECLVNLHYENFISYILVTNTPQVIVSFLYLFYNGLFTSMVLSKEWASIAQHRKPLRVSLPRGEQRSTYFLELPQLYAVPMIAAMTTLHWLISQSLFLVRMNNFDGENFSHVTTSLAYSSIALVFAIALGSVMVLVCIVMGFRRLPAGIPLPGSCSLVISAACHRPDDDVDAARLPLMWGEIKAGGDGEVGHCCITSKGVSRPSPDRLYAGMGQLADCRRRHGRMDD